MNRLLTYLILLIFASTVDGCGEEEISDDDQKNIAITNSKYDSENNGLRFDSITVTEFVELLPINEVYLDNFYIITTIGHADSTWITKSAISKLIKHIDSEQPAYCVMRLVSSHLPIGEKSTLGGQIMNIIDSYRLNRPYPYFQTDCSKSDKERQKVILDWWNKINNLASTEIK
jgi:hypothetical protein